MKQSFYETAIKYLYYILFFITPFAVFPFNSELFEFNKILLIYTISILILGLWILRSMQEGRIYIRKTPLDIPFVLFLISQALSTLFSIDRHTSFFGYYGRFNGGLLSTMTFIFLFYAYLSNIRTHADIGIRRLLTITGIASILVVLWGLPGTFNHDLSCLLFTSKFDNSCWTAQFKPAERMFSTLGQPNWLGAYLAITLFTSLYLLLTTDKRVMRFLATFSMIFSYVGLLLSRSRSALGSLVPGFILIGLYFLWVRFSEKKLPFEKSLRFLLAGLGGLVILTFVLRTGIPKVDSILSFSFLNRRVEKVVVTAPQQPVSTKTDGVTDSLDIRKIVWEGALRLGNEYPLFGTGAETFGYAYYSVRPVAHNLTSEWDYLYNKAHNEYLNMFATTGWFGILSFLTLCLAFIWMLMRTLFKENDRQKQFLCITLFSIFSSILVTNFFGFSITVIQLYWYLLFIVAVVFCVPTSHIHTDKKHNSLSYAQIGIVLFLVLWLLNSVVSYWLADYKYAQSDIALKNNNSAAAVSLLQEALTLRNEHVYEDKLSYALAQYASILAYQKKESEMQQVINVSEKLNLQTIQNSSQNVLYWKTRVKNQFLFYQTSLDKKYLFTGLAALDELYKLAPTDPKIPYFSATYYSLLSDDEKNVTQKQLYQAKSLEAIEKAIELKDNYADAYYLKVQLYKKYGNKSKAREVLEFYIREFTQDNPGLIKELQELQ
ncbi:MAG: O-antigen ligase family protein [Microgenomates group bacterium]